MIISKKEVKTIYNISFTLTELRVLLESYEEGMNQHIYPKAFENTALRNAIINGNDEEAFREFSFFGNRDLYNLTANFFGFDGWKNAGYFNQNKGRYCMTVFDYGDTINQ